MPSPTAILDIAFRRASRHLAKPLVKDVDIARKIENVARNLQNRAGVRWLLACLLAKVHRPSVDIRKPYTEIGGKDCYSGRSYDERYIGPFITKHSLPCNSTTAFLTPALRNRNIVLTPDVDLVGRPKSIYQHVLDLLTAVQQGKQAPHTLLAETVRCLLIFRDEQRRRMESPLSGLRAGAGGVPLSSEAIVTLITQHLACRGASRLPVLVVAAAYRAAAEHLRERVLPLESHTAADEQTGAVGDIQITLLDDDNVVTSYEMKNKRVTQGDIDRALQKLASSKLKVDNYIFITTEPIDERVQDHAREVYDRTNGLEMVILDCLSFLRHFLHLFHRLRTQYLEAYQQLVLSEPNSAVSQPLKEAFLALRQAAESSEPD